MNPQQYFEHPESLLGRSIMIDLTTVDPDDQPVDRRRLRGKVTDVSSNHGITVSLHDGGEYIVPADLRLISEREESRERSDGEPAELHTTLVVHTPPPVMDLPPVEPGENPVVRIE